MNAKRPRLGLPDFRIAIVMMVACCGSIARAQQIEIDRGMRAADLWCFPLSSEPDTYLYLPSRAMLAMDDEGRPQFSFIRYVINETSEDESASSIVEADGGGVLHMLVSYDTPGQQVAAAQAELRRRLENDKVTLRGPVIFESGTYTLISSILTADSVRKPIALATGTAPVLESSAIALSFDLPPQQTTLLMKSFEMATPDLSIVFDMTFAGLSDAYDAELAIDWSQVQTSHAFKAGGSYAFIGAEVRTAIDEMMREHAIQLRSSGSDASMEVLMNSVYDKLMELMFEPVRSTEVNGESGGVLEAVGAMLRSGAARQVTGYGLGAGYQFKHLRSSGTSVLTFDHRARVVRHYNIAFNMGDFHARCGGDGNHFRTVNLADPAFRQRVIHVGVDGDLLPEFEQLINSATVTLRKQHANGETTLRELVVDRDAVTAGLHGLHAVYGWRDDHDMEQWLNYEYRVQWSFRGGGSARSGWRQTSAPMIELFTPYRRQRIEVVGDSEVLTQHGVRAVIVQLEHPFFGEVRRPRLTIRPGRDAQEPALEITLPRDEHEYDYTVSWILGDGEQLSMRHRDGLGVIFIDEPAQAEATTGETP